jgi:hypothetical protein
MKIQQQRRRRMKMGGKQQIVKSEEVERQLRIMLNPRHDIQNFSRTLFTAQCIVLVNMFIWQRSFHVSNIISRVIEAFFIEFQYHFPINQASFASIPPLHAFIYCPTKQLTLIDRAYILTYYRSLTRSTSTQEKVLSLF